MKQKPSNSKQKTLMHYLPSETTIRGDWDNRQIFINDEYVNHDIAARAFPSLTHLLPAQKLALMVLMHFAPVHIVAAAIENITVLNALTPLFRQEDFQTTVNLKALISKALKNDTAYAY